MRFAVVLLAARLYAAAPALEIKVDQTGYLTNSPKIAFVTAGAPAAEFTVRAAKDGAIAFRGKLDAPAADPDSGDRVQAADFSGLDKSGSYYLDVPGVGRSWNFEIGPNIYTRAGYLAMRSYYGQRCGIAVDLGPEFPGFTTRGLPSRRRLAPVLRQDRSAHFKRRLARCRRLRPIRGQLRPLAGTLLWTWGFFGPRLKNVKLNIPESGNGTPDILNEIRWNLD